MDMTLSIDEATSWPSALPLPIAKSWVPLQDPPSPGAATILFRSWTQVKGPRLGETGEFSLYVIE